MKCIAGLVARTREGVVPLHRARTPSMFKIFIRQSVNNKNELLDALEHVFQSLNETKQNQTWDLFVFEIIRRQDVSEMIRQKMKH